MNENIKIANELVKIAHELIAGDLEMTQSIKNMLSNPNSRNVRDFNQKLKKQFTPKKTVKGKNPEE